MKDKIKDIHKILFITLSNLGDIILTTPVLEKLRDEFPEAGIDVITGAPGKHIFPAHPSVKEVIVRARGGMGQRVREISDLRRKRYDLVVDLKNSLVAYFVGAKYHTKLSVFSGNDPKHKRDEHLAKLSDVGIDDVSGANFFIPVNGEEKTFAEELVPRGEDPVVIINPGAKSHLKRWDAAKYAELADRLVSELNCKVVVVGNEDDSEVVGRVMSRVKESVMDLCSKTSIGALAELMRRASLVITNDSAPLHVASAVGTPTVAVFGPSDDRRYGPLSSGSLVLKPEVSCRPCGKALCSIGPDEGCIGRITVEEVFEAAKRVLRKSVETA